jgi:hypothetical protein
VRRVAIKLLALAGAFAAVTCVASASGAERAGRTTSAPTPATVALVGTGTRTAFVRVDPSTLEPLPGFGRVPAPPHAVFDLSENSTRIAIATPRQSVIADTASGRTLWRERNDGYDVSYGLYWVGRYRNALPQAVAVGESKFGYEYTTVTVRGSHGSTDTDLWPAAALRGALVLLGESLRGEGAVTYYGRGGHPTTLLDDPPRGPTRVVADVAGDRIFVVYSAGTVAQVDRDVTYHAVPLNGREFDAVWAGHGQIAVWGPDGLGTIDTRTWSTRSLAPAATGAIPTSFGLVSWHGADGLSVYARDGERRLHVLKGRTVHDVSALARYAYARVGSKQFAVDLRTGRIRSIRSDATVVVPTLVTGHVS